MDDLILGIPSISPMVMAATQNCGYFMIFHDISWYFMRNYEELQPFATSCPADRIAESDHASWNVPECDAQWLGKFRKDDSCSSLSRAAASHPRAPNEAILEESERRQDELVVRRAHALQQRAEKVWVFGCLFCISSIHFIIFSYPFHL